MDKAPANPSALDEDLLPGKSSSPSNFAVKHEKVISTIKELYRKGLLPRCFGVTRWLRGTSTGIKMSIKSWGIVLVYVGGFTLLRKDGAEKLLHTTSSNLNSFFSSVRRLHQVTLLITQETGRHILRSSAESWFSDCAKIMFHLSLEVIMRPTLIYAMLRGTALH